MTKHRNFNHTRDVKRSSNFRSLDRIFEFGLVFQPFDIRFQAALIRPRPFCLDSAGVLSSHSELLCSLPAVNQATPAAFAYLFLPLPSLQHTVAQRTWPTYQRWWSQYNSVMLTGCLSSHKRGGPVSLHASRKHV